MVGVTLARKGVEAFTEAFLERKACIRAPFMERNTIVLLMSREFETKFKAFRMEINRHAILAICFFWEVME
jgi:hypothetical protein